MRRRIARLLLVMFITFCASHGLAETVDVRLGIRKRNTEEETITRENLLRIQQFILKRGNRETYCNAFNNNPAYGTSNYRFYLNPDTGQKNINCDPDKSEFHILTIRRTDGGRNQYRTVEFLDRHWVHITTSWPSDDLTVRQIRQVVVDAMKEILTEINGLAPSKPDAEDDK